MTRCISPHKNTPLPLNLFILLFLPLFEAVLKIHFPVLLRWAQNHGECCCCVPSNGKADQYTSQHILIYFIYQNVDSTVWLLDFHKRQMIIKVRGFRSILDVRTTMTTGLRTLKKENFRIVQKLIKMMQLSRLKAQRWESQQ